MNRKVHVQFGGGRLETQVKLCAGRLPNQDGTTAIQVQPVSNAGRVMTGSLYTVAGGDSSTRGRPAVAFNGKLYRQQYLVVWQYDDRTTNYDIRGQRLDSSFLVNDATDDDNTEPAIAYNSVANEYLIVWRPR